MPSLHIPVMSHCNGDGVQVVALKWALQDTFPMIKCIIVGKHFSDGGPGHDNMIDVHLGKRGLLE